jgi:hypothetical protein
MKFPSWPSLVGVSLIATAVFADSPPTDSAPSGSISQEPIKAFAYHPPAPASLRAFVPRPAATVPLQVDDPAAAGLVQAQQSVPVQMSTFKVSNLPDRTYRDLSAVLGKGSLLGPGPLYSRDLNSGLRLDALSAPLPPLLGESSGGILQARFPLVSLAW